MTFDKIYQYNFPTIIRFGIGSSKELGDYLIKNNLLRPLIVTDPNVSQLGFFKGLIGDIKKKNISTEVFYDIHKNPVKSDVYKGAFRFQPRHYALYPMPLFYVFHSHYPNPG